MSSPDFWNHLDQVSQHLDDINRPERHIDPLSQKQELMRQLETLQICYARHIDPADHFEQYTVATLLSRIYNILENQ